MKNLATLLLLMATLTVSGQAWPEAGATWHFEWSGNLPGFDKIEYVGDTIIQEKDCQHLQITRYMFEPAELGGDLVDTSSFHQYTHTHGDTVFYLVDDTFHVLYNFAALPGETWNLGVDTNELQCGPSSVEVIDTGSTEINGQQMEWILVTTPEGSSVGLEGRIFKRMGAIDDYLFPTTRNCDPDLIVEPFEYVFTCYEDETFPLYNTTDNDCDYLLHVGTDKIIDIERILKIYPNPTNTTINIQISDPGFKVKSIQVYDSQGCRLMTFSSPMKDISSLPAGLYFLRVEFKNGQLLLEKFVKQ